MKFNFPLQQGRLLQRYKRFMADIETAEASVLTIHCPNTGSMQNCRDEGSRVWFWDSENPKRKYPHTWELVEVEQQYLACVNTGRANYLVGEAIESGVITELKGYQTLKGEVRYGDENSRIDWLLTKDLNGETQRCYVEVKNVTLLRKGCREGAGLSTREGAFPDAVSSRGSKHLRELSLMVQQGHRAVLLFCVAHTGIDYVVPADDIDPVYGQSLRQAMADGVEVYAYRTTIDIESGEIYLSEALPVIVDAE